MSNYRILKTYDHTLMMVEDVLGSGVTTNTQLDKLGYMVFGSDYLGTHSSNEFPKYIRNHQCFILNTDSSNSKNKTGHWCGFYKVNDKIGNCKLYYYDSFKRSKNELSKYWINKKMYNANKTDRDQSFLENSCGSRSFSWLILMKKFGERAIDVV